MSNVIYHMTQVFLPVELKAALDSGAQDYDDIVFFLTTTADAGNRLMQLEKRASTATICNAANWLKTAGVILKNKLNADSGVTDVDYAWTTEPDATDLTTAYALLNDIKAKHNALNAKLGSDGGVSQTDYAAQTTVAAADATTPATAITLINECLLDLRALCDLLDADLTVANTNYEALVCANKPAALTASTTKDASANVTASKTNIRITFSTKVSDGNGADYVNTELSEKYDLAAGDCIAINVKVPVAPSGDYITGNFDVLE